MTQRPARHRLSTLSPIAVLILACACGSGDDDGASASIDDDRQPASYAPEPASSAPGGVELAAGCLLDEAAIGDAIGLEVIGIGDCDFAAGAAAGEAVTWSVELYVDPTIPEALGDGTPVDGLGDRAVWNDGLGVLSVQAGDGYFQVQPLRLGEAPIALGAQELAQTVARLVIERS